jgi:hypothetical protein
VNKVLFRPGVLARRRWLRPPGLQEPTAPVSPSGITVIANLRPSPTWPCRE